MSLWQTWRTSSQFHIQNNNAASGINTVQTGWSYICNIVGGHCPVPIKFPDFPRLLELCYGPCSITDTNNTSLVTDVFTYASRVQYLYSCVNHGLTVLHSTLSEVAVSDAYLRPSRCTRQELTLPRSLSNSLTFPDRWPP